MARVGPQRHKKKKIGRRTVAAVSKLMSLLTLNLVLCGAAMETIAWLWSLIKTNICPLRACCVGKHCDKLAEVKLFIYCHILSYTVI